MAEFIRPEVTAAALKWREAIAGGVVIAAGLWLALTRFGFVSWLGWIVAALGVALIYTGVQHQRFRTGGQGPGVVEIDERRITYFGPLTGGMADLDLLARLELDPTGTPAHWLLTAENGASLAIPVTAEGAEALFDLFASLPGLRTEAMLSALRAPPPSPLTLWEAPQARLR